MFKHCNGVMECAPENGNYQNVSLSLSLNHQKTKKKIFGWLVEGAELVYKYKSRSSFFHTERERGIRSVLFFFPWGSDEKDCERL